MRWSALAAVGMVALASIMPVAGCGGEASPACDEYPGYFDGRVTGTVDGAAFEADVLVSRSFEILDGAGLTYAGSYDGTGPSQAAEGRVTVPVECASGRLMTAQFFTEDGALEGTIDGTLPATGGTGTWSCTKGCQGDGTWMLEPGA